MLKSLPPGKTDFEIHSLSATPPFVEMVAFIESITTRLRSKHDYELCQVWMSVFLKKHGSVLAEAAKSSGVASALSDWKEAQTEESERLSELVGFCAGVASFVRAG